MGQNIPDAFLLHKSTQQLRIFPFFSAAKAFHPKRKLAHTSPDGGLLTTASSLV